MSFMPTRVGAVFTVCGNRVYDLPDYYLDAVIKMKGERMRAKRAYDLAHARRMRNLRHERKEGGK